MGGLANDDEMMTRGGGGVWPMMTICCRQHFGPPQAKIFGKFGHGNTDFPLQNPILDCEPGKFFLPAAQYDPKNTKNASRMVIQVYKLTINTIFV